MELDHSGWKDVGLVEWRHKDCGHVSMRRSDDTEERPCPVCAFKKAEDDGERTDGP
jgi:hypothetical protein